MIGLSKYSLGLHDAMQMYTVSFGAGPKDVKKVMGWNLFAVYE